MQFGRYLEEFAVGDTYKHWPGKTITQAEDILFCAITQNQHPLHSDDNYAAAATPHGKAMVVGNLVYSIVLGQSVPDVSGRAIANLEIQSLKHANPTFHGDTIYSETEVLEVRESKSKPDRGHRDRPYDRLHPGGNDRLRVHPQGADPQARGRARDLPGSARTEALIGYPSR